MTWIDRMGEDFGEYYYRGFADTVQYILKDIFICIIQEQCSDQEEKLKKTLEILPNQCEW
jgi:hypothetical protein